MNPQLEGVRIWLSASIHKDASADERQRIEAFIAAFAKAVFHRGAARLVHGSQPEVRQILLDTAQKHKAENEGAKPGLVMVVSRFFSAEPEKNGIDLQQWNDVCAEKVIETRAASALGGLKPEREPSLAIMRDVLAEQCNVLVAVGGRWWDSAMDMAGIPKEITLAQEHRLPCFLVAGLGGATRGHVDENQQLLRVCNNGWDKDQNKALTVERDPKTLAEMIVDQISLLPVRERSPDSGRPFRILALDGGGMRGAFTAAVLAYWEQKFKCKIVDHFDIIAGTSTGGLLAIGLGLGKTAAEMLQFYRVEGPKIFGADNETERWWHSFRHWFGTKYDGAALRSALTTAYAGKTMDESLCRLVIPVYGETMDSPDICRTPHVPFHGLNSTRDPVQIGCATAAAPTYFQPVAVQTAVAPFDAVDGGVWANCPAAVALAEAVGRLNISPHRIDLLSIGTTYTTDPQARPLILNKQIVGAVAKSAGGLVGAAFGFVASLAAKALWKDQAIRGKLGYAANIAGFLMKAQMQTTEHVCQGLLGDRYLRVDSASDVAELDDTSRFNELANMGQTEAIRHEKEVQLRFLNEVPADDWKQEVPN